MWLYVLAIPLIFHGAAHLSGAAAPWVTGRLGYADAAWLLPGDVKFAAWGGQSFSLVWLAAAACLGGAGAGLLLHQPWAKTAAIVGCGLSLAAIVPWWRAVPPGARAGAAFDLAVLAVLLSPLSKLFVR